MSVIKTIPSGAARHRTGSTGDDQDQGAEVPGVVQPTLWVPKTVSPYVTWEYWRMRPPGQSRRRTRPAAPQARGYTEVYGRYIGGPGCSDAYPPGPADVPQELFRTVGVQC